ncbi:MAG TPA: hypothetical protein VF053_01765 [Streptosporangiales bacterium]
MANSHPLPSEPLLDEPALMQHIQFLLSHGAPGGRELWLIFLDDARRPVPTVTNIDDVPVAPERRLVVNLFEVIGKVLDESVIGGSVAVVMERLGTPEITLTDRLWGASLRECARNGDIPMHGPYLAVPGAVLPLPGHAHCPRRA